MKISRRGFFGLGAGAAVVPFVKPVTPAFAEAVAEALPGAAKIASRYVTGGPIMAPPGLNAMFGNDFGTVEVIERAKNRLARAHMDAVYAKMYRRQVLKAVL